VRLVADGAVAFARNASGRSSVALVTPLGDDAIVTLQDGAFLHDWTWSPDGSRLAGTFGDTGDASEAVLVMEPDGTVIGNHEGAMGPAWSPDGSRLAWIGNEGRIVVTDDSLEPATFLDAGRAPHAIAWAPDGSRLAYLAVDCDACPPDEPILGDPPIAVFTIAIDGSERQQITSGNIDGAPSWSADGSQIAFLRFDLSGEFSTRLLVLGATGGDPVELVEGAAVTGGVAWSPDGTRLALATSAGTLIASPDGTQELIVPTDEDTLVTEIQWSPSGRYLLYGATTDSSPAPRLWIVEADGSGEPRAISPSGEAAAQGRWQPVLVAP
jgi:Tol biopolymer transport system component